MSKLFDEFGYIHCDNREEAMKVRCAENVVSIFEWEDYNSLVTRTWYDIETKESRQAIEPMKGYSFLFCFLDIENDNGIIFSANPIKNSKLVKEVGSREKTTRCYLDSKRKIVAREGYKLIYEGKRNEG